MTNNSTSNVIHVPVLLNEVLDNLIIPNAGRVLDLTLGLGGHAAAILAKSDSETRYLGIDRDPNAIYIAKNKFRSDSRITIIKSTYEDAIDNINVLNWMKLYAESGFDTILMDLGISGLQIKDSNRGFSFMLDGPLDMRMDNDNGMTALDWIKEQTEYSLALALYQYGEERASRPIARAILRSLLKNTLHTTFDLAEAVYTVLPNSTARHKKQINPATRTFQAIRIAVNNELLQLDITIRKLVDYLKIGGRLGIISFHSLEDRIVKQTLRKLSGIHNRPRRFPVELLPKYLRLIHPGGLTPKNDELMLNISSRSARLRIGERI